MSFQLCPKHLHTGALAHAQRQPVPQQGSRKREGLKRLKALWADGGAVHHWSEEGGPDGRQSAGYVDTVELCHEDICMSARGS